MAVIHARVYVIKGLIIPHAVHTMDFLSPPPLVWSYKKEKEKKNPAASLLHLRIIIQLGPT